MYKMEEMYQAAHHPVEKDCKWEEGYSEEMSENKEGKDSSLHSDLPFMEKRSFHIKQEDCEWESAYPQQGDLGIKKEEDVECWPVGVKEDPDQKCDSHGVQKHETVNGIKEEDHLKSESVSQFVCSGNVVCGTNITPSKPSFLLDHSDLTESLKHDMKMSERAAGSSHSEEDLVESGDFFPSSSPQTSLQKQYDENMKKPTFASGTITSCLQCPSLPAVKLTLMDTLNSQQQGQNKKPHDCFNCGKQFPAMIKHKIHTQIHIEEKLHCCSECGKRFSRKTHLQRHILIHTGEKPYFCSECGKQFSDERNLKTHERIHTGEKPFCCSYCGKRFFYISSLQTHTTMHTGEKQFCCSECGKLFPTITKLKVHTRVHTGEKPYCCFECGKQFSRQNNLKRHTQTHTRVKPYWCPECGKQFSQKTHLQKHTQVHIRLKKEVCSTFDSE
ncbi:zinc finger protein OZF-like [Erpetoichthys calabaricus]|uniref:C2H2-type domain-containing protein n=1 Tax=Erpetoichthys calabaricus TaxID=27687 RepID=A0A8C4RNE3_ERPCA|nr:zinc finger protein OZF-like [Erpetoichthys calabaricus]XP_051782449.1 zinc finger protein OZF-like [Erpetoichthys calabaricus]